MLYSLHQLVLHAEMYQGTIHKAADWLPTACSCWSVHPLQHCSCQEPAEASMLAAASA